MAEEATATETVAQETTTETAETTTEAPQTEATVVDDNGEAVSETIYADKFKSVSDLEKSYKELQSTFSKKMGQFVGAPEEGYSFETEGLSEQDQGLVNTLSEWGKENQLSQEGFENLVTKYNEYQAQQQEAMITAEFEKLGSDAKVRIDNARSFLEANLGEDATKALAKTMNTAESIEAVEKLIALSKSPAPAQVQATPIDADKVKAMRFATDENGQRLMSIDPKYRAKVLEMEAKLVS